MYESAVASSDPGLEARFLALLAAAGLIEPDAWSGALARDERAGYEPTADWAARDGAALHGAAAADEAAAGTSTIGPVTLAELRERGLDLSRLADVVEAGGLLADAAAALELTEEPDAAITDAAVALHRQTNRTTGLHLRVLAQLSRRGLHRDDAAMTPAAWLRHRAHLDPDHATALLNAAERLPALPQLQAALEAGETTWEHVRAVTAKCTSARAEEFASADAALTTIARVDEPKTLRRAVQRIIDCIDPDGSDEEDLPQGPRDHRRELHLQRSIDGLWFLRGTLDVLTGEQLMGFLDAFSTRDDPDTPIEQRRSAAQRRHDALDAFLQAATGIPDLPTVHGRTPHILGMFDWTAFAKLAGLLRDDVVVGDGPLARLRYAGPISTGLARHLLTEAAFTFVRTEGPGRVVDVGRRMRTLPAHLRDVLQLLHRRCRGPDCDRWVTWTEAHHQQRYEHGGRTDLNQSIPLCSGHHDLDDHGWNIELDPDTLIVTWTSPTGRIITTRP